MRVTTFVNKKNGQISIALPKKKMKDFLVDKPEGIPKKIKISLWR